jgi:Flp pilus assembly protein TadB
MRGETVQLIKLRLLNKNNRLQQMTQLSGTYQSLFERLQRKKTQLRHLYTEVLLGFFGFGLLIVLFSSVVMLVNNTFLLLITITVYSALCFRWMKRFRKLSQEEERLSTAYRARKALQGGSFFDEFIYLRRT